MKWSSRTDYHNTRRYDDDTLPVPDLGRVGLARTGWLDAARKALRRLLADKRGPRATIVLKGSEHRGFTLLGSTIARYGVREPLAPCPFPERDGGPVARLSTRRHRTIRANDI